MTARLEKSISEITDRLKTLTANVIKLLTVFILQAFLRGD